MITLYGNAIASGALWLIGIRQMCCCLKLVRESNSASSLLGKTKIVELIIFVQRETSSGLQLACLCKIFVSKCTTFLRFMWKLNASLLL